MSETNNTPDGGEVEPVAWRAYSEFDNSSDVTDSPDIADQWRADGLTVDPLYVVKEWIANCCVCGRVVDTREEAQGGDKFGCQLEDGRWTCSEPCWSSIVDPDASPEQCEVVRELVEVLKLHVAYEALPADRGGKSGPKGRAWQAFIDARDAALAKIRTEGTK